MNKRPVITGMISRLAAEAAKSTKQGHRITEKASK